MDADVKGVAFFSHLRHYDVIIIMQVKVQLLRLFLNGRVLYCAAVAKDEIS